MFGHQDGDGPHPLLADPRMQRHYDPARPVWIHLDPLLGEHTRAEWPPRYNRATFNHHGVYTERWCPGLLHAWLVTDRCGWAGLVTWTHPGEHQRLGGGLELRALIPATMLAAAPPRRTPHTTRPAPRRAFVIRMHPGTGRTGTSSARTPT